MGGCFRVNMYRNTEIAKESMNTATSSEDTLQNDASNEKIRDKFGINERIRDKFGINEEVRENYGETATNILCLMLEKPENTLDSIANTLGVTRRTVEKQVKKLKEVGIVSRVGSNKSGSWKVDIKEDRQFMNCERICVRNRNNLKRINIITGGQMMAAIISWEQFLTCNIDIRGIQFKFEDLCRQLFVNEFLTEIRNNVI